MLFTGLLLTIALSLDGFIVGLLYGMRRISLPWRSLAILGLCTSFGMGVSMLSGGVIAEMIPESMAGLLGGALLIALGLWQLVEGWREYLRTGAPSARAGLQSLLKLNIRPLGIVVHVLADPVRADRDRSGVIDKKEAWVLGVALGLDALAAGFAAAMIGFGPILIASVGLGLLVLVKAGVAAGSRVNRLPLGRKGMFVPGVILIVMGLLHV